MAATSGTLMLIAFFLYLASTIAFAVAVTGKKWRNKDGEMKGNRWGLFGFIFSILAAACSLGYFVIRWTVAGHAPVSNMYEYMTFLGIAMGLAFILIFSLYRSNVIGLFTMPTVMLLIAYASLFPREVAPLIPALQSNWLKIHVITTALGQGILSIGFAAGLVYLIRTMNYRKPGLKTAALEWIMYAITSLIGYIGVGYLFKLLNYETVFSYINELDMEAEMTYNLPALVGPNQAELLTSGQMEPFFNVWASIRSDDLNTVIWSFISGAVLYLLLRLILRKRIGHAIQPLLKSVNPDQVDEVSYRAIAIGFPIFALGGLVFAMLWAQIAWTRFWGWDPKEVWALVTFLFYAVYLHLRLSNGWHGEKSAWLCVIGFAIIMFNLVFVNLVIAGLHSYA
ncbi:c-type cytochrome biogenesis protein CcsB [Alkalicoccobacillus murimartini]|uniref:Cytochrome c-type biogenesis protein CcsB n=1 Tax=Alkalicoccobacillus murimartini TaxID=171685 RepID=A0ABT9YDD9_9BACI|nr:c-type cytochrome biogenesis protein CcsB [Alkalicoccobacillus murimartini]MDQ0205863.1 cytochrome c-type biogenesis protein CcsB [Alkalicoccobacillus murimartini]